MNIVDFATLGIVGCMLALVAIVSDWTDTAWHLTLSPAVPYERPIEPKRMVRGFTPTYPHDEADE